MSDERATAIRPPSKPAAVFVNEDGGGSVGGKDVSLDDLFGENPDANARRSVEAVGDHNEAELMERVAFSDDEEAEVEVEKTCRVLPSPGNPTDAHREEHRASGHLPYRTWCEECVAARATGEPHRQRTGKRTACVFAFNYFYLSKSGSVIPRNDLGDREEIDLVVLVAKDVLAEAHFAHVVPQKGVDQDHFVVDALIEDIQ